MFLVVLPVTHIPVVIRVDVLTFAKFDSFQYFSLVFLTIAEEVDAVALECVVLPLASIHVSLGIVVDAFALSLVG